MLDEKEEKRQKRNVEFGVLLMICAVIIAYEYNLHGYALVLSFVIGLSIMWTTGCVVLDCVLRESRKNHQKESG